MKFRYKLVRPAESSAPSFVARLPHGAVELLAVSSYPVPTSPIWTPDGRPFKGQSPWEGDRVSSGMHVEGASVMREIACRVSTGAGSPSDPVMRFDKNSGLSSPYTSRHWEDESKSTLLVKAEIASLRKANEATFKVGVAEGKWETILHVQPPVGTLPIAASSITEPDGRWEARLESVTGEGGDIAVTSLLFHYSIKEEYETRMASLRNDGTVTPLERTDGALTQDGLKNSIVKMAAVNYERIKEFQLQRRRYQWVEFQNVSLESGNRTLVKIEPVRKVGRQGLKGLGGKTGWVKASKNAVLPEIGLL